MLHVPSGQVTDRYDTSGSSDVTNALDKRIRATHDFCIDSHEAYCSKHGYAFFMETQEYVGRSAYWQKIFSLAMLMASALEGDTLDWIFWTDTDTMILNDEIKLESFLPPSHEAWNSNDTDVHVLMSRDHRGWNNGAFLIRVHPWSLNYLIRSYTWPDYHAGFESFEQTAMARLYEEFEDVRRHVVRVPMKWFNAYPSGRSVYVATDQDLQVHFPGTTNKDLMAKSVENVQNGLQYRHNVPYVGDGRIIEEDGMTGEAFWHAIINGTIQRGGSYAHQ